MLTWLVLTDMDERVLSIRGGEKVKDGCLFCLRSWICGKMLSSQLRSALNLEHKAFGVCAVGPRVVNISLIKTSCKTVIPFN